MPSTNTISCSLCGYPAQVEFVSNFQAVYANHENLGLKALCDNSGKRITTGN